MAFQMGTTLNIVGGVMRRLREEAARRGMTMYELVEAGLRRILGGESGTRQPRRQLPPLPSWHSGGARVDAADRSGLYDLMDGG
jgi:hypothetical protein